MNELEGRCVMVLACNTQHTGAGMRIAPQARLDDGLLDLFIVPELSRGRLLALMWRIPGGRHLEAPELGYRRVSGFELLAGKGRGRRGRDGWCLNVDGETLAQDSAGCPQSARLPGRPGAAIRAWRAGVFVGGAGVKLRSILGTGIAASRIWVRA